MNKFLKPDKSFEGMYVKFPKLNHTGMLVGRISSFEKVDHFDMYMYRLMTDDYGVYYRGGDDLYDLVMPDINEMIEL